MRTAPQTKARPVRLSWALTAAALTAFGALGLTGGWTPVLPALALGLLATYLFDARIEPPDWWIHWILRLALYAAIGYLNANKANEQLVDAFGQAAATDTLGQWMAAELVIQAWRRQPAGGPGAAAAILLSGLTLVSACQTSDEQYPRLLVPLYMFFLLVSLQRPARGAAAVGWAALAVALGGGAATYQVVWGNRAPLTAWGMRYMEGRPAPETTGLSSQPFLGETFGLRGSPRRVLRITGLDGPTYLRGAAYDSYDYGRWGPRMDRRGFLPYVSGAHGGEPGAAVTPLASTDGLLLAPLGAGGLNLGDNSDAQWAPDSGGPIRVRVAQPAPYRILPPAAGSPAGLFTAPPSPPERLRCLAVPPDMEPGVWTLARQIGGSLHDPRRRIQAVRDYLITHHRYSLTIHPGAGDPVSSFLLRQPPQGAHCEYFAASAAILLRCLGVPTRYVVGYYAHESDGPGLTVVRQRDAHAWAEAWVAGSGWVTVDATPGDGRPHGDINSIPPWQRLTEWLADRAVATREWLLARDWPRLSLWIGGGAVLGLLLRTMWRRLRRAGPETEKQRGYSLPDADLAALSTRFEAALARAGIPCPSGQPWQEHLAASGQESAAARTFVRAYNRARFGPATDADRERLRPLLVEAEEDLSRTMETPQEVA